MTSYLHYIFKNSYISCSVKTKIISTTAFIQNNFLSFITDSGILRESVRDGSIRGAHYSPCDQDVSRFIPQEGPSGLFPPRRKFPHYLRRTGKGYHTTAGNAGRSCHGVFGRVVLPFSFVEEQEDRCSVRQWNFSKWKI